MYIRLEFSNGNEVFVNSDHVRYVTKDDCNEGMSNINLIGATLYVKGDPRDIVERMTPDGHWG